MSLTEETSPPAWMSGRDERDKEVRGKMTELDGIVKRQADEAVDRVQTLAKIAQIEAALCSFIEKKASEANTVENAKAIAKVAECYFELSNRFWTSARRLDRCSYGRSLARRARSCNKPRRNRLRIRRMPEAVMEKNSVWSSPPWH